MKYLALLLLLTGCATPTKKPLCRHIVLAQYAAFRDAGYEAEIWQLNNINPQSAGSKYHAAVRVKVCGQWLWVEQQSLTFTTTTQQPFGTTLRRKLSASEVLEWAERE